MSQRVRYAIAIGGLVVISALSGAVAGYVASALHPGPPGRPGTDASARGCWYYAFPNRGASSTNTICLERR